MYRYTVTDSDPVSRRVVLRDPSGQCHVAHCKSDLPAIEQVLGSNLPVARSTLLVGTSGKVYRLTFSQFDCTQSLAPQHLRPAPGSSSETAAANTAPA